MLLIPPLSQTVTSSRTTPLPAWRRPTYGRPHIYWILNALSLPGLNVTSMFSFVCLLLSGTEAHSSISETTFRHNCIADYRMNLTAILMNAMFSFPTRFVLEMKNISPNVVNNSSRRPKWHVTERGFTIGRPFPGTDSALPANILPPLLITLLPMDDGMQKN